MKQTVLTFFAALCAVFCTTVNAQAINQDSASGGPLTIITTATFTVHDSETVRVRNEWGYNPTFVPYSPSNWDTISNTWGYDSTFTVTDTISIPLNGRGNGNLFVRWDLDSLTDSTLTAYASNYFPVYVPLVPVAPTVALGTIHTIANHGGTALISYNAGNTTMNLKYELAIGNDTLGGARMMDTTIALTDSGTFVYTFDGYPAYVDFSFRFFGFNPAGSDSTTIGFINVPASGLPWIGSVINPVATPSSINVGTVVIPNSNNLTATTYISLLPGVAPFDSVHNAVSGQSNSITVGAAFSGLVAQTKYYVWTCADSFGICGPVDSVFTAPQPIVFGLVMTSVTGSAQVNAQVGTVTLTGTVTNPNTLCQIGSFGTLSTDVNFNDPDEISPDTTFNGGVWQYTYTFSYIPVGVPMLYIMYGFSNGSYINSNTISYTLPFDTVVVIPDTIVVTSISASAVTATTLNLSWVVSSNDSIQSNTVSNNGSVLATLPGNRFTYSPSGLIPGSTDTFKVTSVDQAGHAASRSIVVQMGTLPIVPDTIEDTNLDTTGVDTTTADLAWNTYTNDGVKKSIVTNVGVGIVGTFTNGQTTCHVTGLTPNTLYTFGVTSQDSAGTWSSLQTIEVLTYSLSDPQAYISSIPNSCFKDTASGGGWVLTMVTGSGFYPGATYQANYQYSGYVDNDTIHYIDPTHCMVWIWISYFDNVTFTITNPGALASNPVQTQVVDCGTSAITNQTKPNDRRMLKAYPNPVVGDVIIEVGQPAEYIITAIDGRLVRTGKFKIGLNMINLQDLAPGIYIVNTKETNLSTKLVKQ